MGGVSRFTAAQLVAILLGRLFHGSTFQTTSPSCSRSVHAHKLVHASHLQSSRTLIQRQRAWAQTKKQACRASLPAPCVRGTDVICRLEDLLELRKLRRSRQGIEASRLIAGDARRRRRREDDAEQEEERGGLRAGTGTPTTPAPTAAEDEDECVYKSPICTVTELF
jgi:hypothetical protein